MPNNELIYRIIAQDDASITLSKIKTEAQSAGKALKDGFDQGTQSINQTDQTTQNYFRSLERQVRQSRRDYELINRTIGSVALAMTVLGDSSDKEFSKIQQATQKGIVAFTGFQTLLLTLGMSSGWGAVAAGIGAIGIAMLSLEGSTNATKTAVSEFIKKLSDKTDYTAYLESTNNLIKANEIQTKEWQNQLIILDDKVSRGIELTKNEQEQQATLKENLKINRNQLEVYQDLKKEIQGQVSNQNALRNVEAAMSTIRFETSKTYEQSLKKNIEDLKKQAEEVKNVVGAEQKYQKIINDLKIAQDKLTEAQKDTTTKEKEAADAKEKQTQEGLKRLKEFQDAQDVARNLKNINDENKLKMQSLFIEGKIITQYKDESIEMTNLKMKLVELYEKKESDYAKDKEEHEKRKKQISELKIDEETKNVYIRMSEYDLEGQKIALEAKYAIDKKKIDKEIINQEDKENKERLDKFKKLYHEYEKEAKKAIDMISKFDSQKHEANISRLETERDQALAKIDAELSAEGLSEERKKELLANRAKIEADYNNKVKKEKEAQWVADRDAKAVMAIIDTASAVVEALPNIPLSIIAGIMGAAQLAIIESQKMPSFHTGGSMFFDASPSQEMPIMIRGQETIRVNTPEQESRQGSIINVNIYGPIADEIAFKNIVEKGLRKTGLTVDKYFINNKTNISLVA